MTDTNGMRDLIFVDTETLGLVAGEHEVWEIALIRTDPTGFVEKERYEAMVAPRNPGSFQAKALEVNHFRERFALEKCTPTDQVVAKLTEMTQDQILVGQNVSFDEGMLKAFLRANGRNSVPWHYHQIDVSALWHPERVKRGLSSSSLVTIAKELGVQQAVAHQAMADTVTAWECYKVLCKMYGVTDPSSLAK